MIILLKCKKKFVHTIEKSIALAFRHVRSHTRIQEEGEEKLEHLVFFCVCVCAWLGCGVFF